MGSAIFFNGFVLIATHVPIWNPVALEFAGLEISISPDRLNEMLTKNKGFTENGLIIWKKLESLFNDVLVVNFYSRPTHEIIDRALLDKKTVITKIYLNDRVQDWVLIVGKDQNEYLVKDPLRDSSELTKLSDITSNIHRLRIIEKRNGDREF